MFFKLSKTLLVLFGVSMVWAAGSFAQERILPKMKLTLGKVTLSVELAVASSDRNRGLGGRKKLTSGQGMLFVFEPEQPVTFWMKDTLIPLDIAFIDKTGKIFQIETMQVEKSAVPQKHFKSKMPVRYALEVNAGWFKRNGIKVGYVLPELQQPH
jgi:hypothetical protein